MSLRISSNKYNHFKRKSTKIVVINSIMIFKWGLASPSLCFPNHPIDKSVKFTARSVGYSVKLYLLLIWTKCFMS